MRVKYICVAQLTVKLSTVLPTNSMDLYVAPETDISPIICKVKNHLTKLLNNDNQHHHHLINLIEYHKFLSLKQKKNRKKKNR